MLKHKSLWALGAVAVVGLIFIAQAMSQPAEQPTPPPAPPAVQPAPPAVQPGADQGGRPRFDPAQFRSMMSDRMKEVLGASDDDWKALGAKVDKVMTLTLEARLGGSGMGAMFMGRGRGGRGGTPGADPAADAPPQSKIEKAGSALAKMLDNKESKIEDIKTALQALRDARAEKEAELDKAQTDLRTLLTIRQEAILVRFGMMK